jgi:hypothetical protein
VRGSVEANKISEIVTALAGLKCSEWSRVKQKVDMLYSSKAAKVTLDDSELLKTNLEVEFNLRQFGEKSD